MTDLNERWVSSYVRAGGIVGVSPAIVGLGEKHLVSVPC
jgi:hypothetical protein